MSSKFSANVEKVLNEQITWEYASAYLYLAMSIFCATKNLNGIAQWFRVQYEEEMSHGDRILKYMLDRGAVPTISSIEKPRNMWGSVLEVFQDSLTHEKKVTGLINNILVTATADKDYATMSFIQWFIDEQVEEEASFEEIIAKIEMLGEKGSHIYFLDKELGKRKED